MNTSYERSEMPEGVSSLLDTDLYKLTMQCCILEHFPDTNVTYSFTNRTPQFKFNHAAFTWFKKQIMGIQSDLRPGLENLRLSDHELQFLRRECPYFSEDYIRYLYDFNLRPQEQVEIKLLVPQKGDFMSKEGYDVELHIKGRWVDTILYEIPILALASEAYFKFCDTDWRYDGQVEKAYQKGCILLKEGCLFSEFGTRRRRDYHTHELVLDGLCKAQQDAKCKNWPGKLSGTSNVHFAMRYGLTPVGTIAHEWFMGIAAITNNYKDANEIALRYWVLTYGAGVLSVALTDTFGTPAFLEAFRQPIPQQIRATTKSSDSASSRNTVSAKNMEDVDKREAGNPASAKTSNKKWPTYADIFRGVRQDSGDPEDFIRMMQNFYKDEGISDNKVIVFSDALNTELCLRYKSAAEAAEFQPTFGIGTFLTNDFINQLTSRKSAPLNIVIKLATANGKPAIKISDNSGKVTGDKGTVAEVKKILGYDEHSWKGGDEANRWADYSN